MEGIVGAGGRGEGGGGAQRGGSESRAPACITGAAWQHSARPLKKRRAWLGLAWALGLAWCRGEKEGKQAFDVSAVSPVRGRAPGAPVLPRTLARTPSVLHPVPLTGPTSARSHSTQQKAEGLPRWPTAFASSAEGCLVTRRVPDRPQAEVRAAGLARHVQQQQHRRLLSQK